MGSGRHTHYSLLTTHYWSHNGVGRETGGYPTHPVISVTPSNKRCESSAPTGHHQPIIYKLKKPGVI